MEKRKRYEPTVLGCLLFCGLLLAVGEPSRSADWPQVLGPERNGRYPGELRSTWPEEGPAVLWRREVGSGFSGPAVAGGTVVIYHRRADRDVVEAVAAATGEVRWSFEHPTSYADRFGFDNGPRATPTIADGRVFTWSAEARLHALALETGEKLWEVDARDRFGARWGTFGATSSPLWVDGRLVVGVGGPDGAGIVAFDAATGEVLWQATDDKAGYSSPVVATFGGRRRLLVWSDRTLFELDPVSGEVARSFPWRAMANAATPLVIGERIFLSASYGIGAVLLDAGGEDFQKVWSSHETLSNHYSTSVYRDGHLYGFHGMIMPGNMSLPGNSSGVTLRCVELESGKTVWEERALGPGTLLLAAGQLVILTESGELVLAPASPSGFAPTARASVLPPTVRALPALADARFYARGESELIALDLSPEP